MWDRTRAGPTQACKLEARNHTERSLVGSVEGREPENLRSTTEFLGRSDVPSRPAPLGVIVDVVRLGDEVRD